MLTYRYKPSEGAVASSKGFFVYEQIIKSINNMKKVLTFLSSAFFAFGAMAQNLENGHEYVDLGLPSGTLWATCNVGADVPESYGDYYAWGETETHYNEGGNTESMTWKDGYSAGYAWSNYKYMDSNVNDWNGITKYTCEDGQKDVVWYDANGTFIGDNKTELDDEDDVAVKKWGGKWKMPTFEQQTELYNNCYWVWTTTYNGKSVNGYIVFKAKKAEDKGVKVLGGSSADSSYDVAEDTHIFIPAAGFCMGSTGVELVGIAGYLRSRSIDMEFSNFAGILAFDSDGVYASSFQRVFGQPVRPVVPGTSTAIETINTYKGQKTIKTSENGRVVIIRDGLKYDLSGRRLY